MGCMGSGIKKVANAIVNFFRKVINFFCEGAKKVAEVVVNGVKTVINYFKKLLEYSWNGIKIFGKIIYYAGKQIIHSLCGKEGIPYLIEFYNSLQEKGISVRDENNNEINPKNFFDDIGKKMGKNHLVDIQTNIIPNEDKKDKEKSIHDFKEKDDFDDLKKLIGMKVK